MTDTSPARKQDVATQQPTDEATTCAFLAAITYRRNERNPPDDTRRAQFTMQWQRSARGEPMTEQTLRAKLTLANLG